jgi:hypothetical protein
LLLVGCQKFAEHRQHLDHLLVFVELVLHFDIPLSPMGTLDGIGNHLVGSLDLEHRLANLLA